MARVTVLASELVIAPPLLVADDAVLDWPNLAPAGVTTHRAGVWNSDPAAHHRRPPGHRRGDDGRGARPDRSRVLQRPAGGHARTDDEDAIVCHVADVTGFPLPLLRDPDTVAQMRAARQEQQQAQTQTLIEGARAAAKLLKAPPGVAGCAAPAGRAAAGPARRRAGH